MSGCGSIIAFMLCYVKRSQHMVGKRHQRIVLSVFSDDMGFKLSNHSAAAGQVLYIISCRGSNGMRK